MDVASECRCKVYARILIVCFLAKNSECAGIASASAEVLGEKTGELMYSSNHYYGGVQIFDS